MPLCSIGSRLFGIPSYLVDSASGMRELARHLVIDHGYQRLAFIGGPAANEEALERLAAFRSELALHGLEMEPEDVVHGDFMSTSGQAALQILLRDPEHYPQAIVAANDAMAMGALEALTSRSPEVARQIAVCGFDNVVETDFCSPPLTTVEQPLRRLAEAAVAGLVAQLAGQDCPEVTRFEARPVLRRSCGCDATLAAAPEMQRRKASRRNSMLEFLRHRPDIDSQVVAASAGAYDDLPGWHERLVGSFIDQVRDVSGADFSSQVRDLLQHTTRDRPGETWRFHNVLSAMRRHCLPCVAGDATQWAKAEDLLQTARTLTGEAVLRGQARRLLSADQQHLSSNQAGTRLGEARDERQLHEALRAAMKELRIGKLVVVEYVAYDELDDVAARALFVITSNERSQASSPGVFPLTRLVPVDEWLQGETGSWVALPLFYRGEPLGYLLAELSLDDGKAYESLRVHVSAALWALRERSR
jgi:hypothetical protein